MRLWQPPRKSGVLKHHSEAYRRFNAIPALILAGVVAVAPLPLGSVDSVFVALWCGMLGVAAIALDPSGLQRYHLFILAAAAALAALFLAVAALQSVPLASPASSKASEWWRETSQLLAEPVPPIVSVVRQQGLYAIGVPAVCFLAFVTSLVVGISSERAQSLVHWIGWVGAAYALFGISSFLIDPTRLLIFEKIGHREALTATFTNRNTAAIYFGAIAIIWIMRAVTRLKRYSNRSTQPFSMLGFRRMPRTIIWHSALALLCLIAMFMTGSRAGILLSLAAILIAIILLLRDRLAHVRLIKLALIAIASVGVLWLILGGSVAQRIAFEGLSDGGRFGIYVSSVDIAKDNWLLGTGLGTFRRALPPYRPDDVPIWGIWDRAHNTLIEIAVEMGIPVAIAVFAGLLAILALLYRGSTTMSENNSLCICGFCVALLSFAHSLVEFSLQIPGFAITAFIIIGVGVARIGNGKLHTQASALTTRAK